jgi:alkaline phosphatase
MDPFAVGLVNTPSSSNVITDSAAGATAYSCALKTYNGAVGVDQWRKPCGTLLEAAKAKGMRTGVVVTSRLSHATPAAFTAHSVSRDYEDFIASQQVNQSIDVLFGGGAAIFKKYEPVATSRGYQIIHSAAELRQQTLRLPVLGLFAEDHMNYEIDRNNELQPSLAEMTYLALNLLSQNNTNGFFLFVEGSRIDHAAHANDAAAHYHDILAFNDAWEVALNFAQHDKSTMVISTADHETGGLTLARTNQTAANQTGPWPENAFPYVWYPDVITRINKSAEQLTYEFVARGCPPLTAFDSVVYQYTGQHLTPSIRTALEALFLPNGTLPANLRGRFEYTLAAYLSEAAYISWSTHGHSGVNVVLYAYNADLRGVYENVEIGQYLAKTFDFNLNAITESLRTFVPIPPETLSAATVEDRYHSHRHT